MLHQRLTAFAESGEYDIHRVDSTNPYVRAYRFEKVFSMAGISDSRFLFESLRQLDRAFFSEAAQAQDVYLHNAQGEDSPLPGIEVNIGEKPVMGRAVSFQPGANVRLLSFNKPDDHRHCFLMIWSQYLKRDMGSDREQVWFMTGEIYEFEGRKPKSLPHLSAYQPKAASKEGGAEAVRAETFEELHAKVKRLCEIYGRETDRGRTSAVIILSKLCNAYAGRLTERQYNALIAMIDPLYAKTKNESHQQMLGLSCYTLYQKSEHYKETDEQKELREKQLTPHFGHSSVTMANLSKIITYDSMMLSEADQAECTITGRTEPDAETVTLRRWPQMENMGEYPVDAGEINIKCKLPKNEIIEIFSKDGNVLFVADGGNLVVNLPEREVGSSESKSFKINEFLNSTRRLERSLWEEKDEARKSAMMNTLRDWFRSGLRDHRGDLISAFALFKSYSEMNAGQLKPYMSDDYAFSNHPLLAPVREYYEGLLKRRPGTKFQDAELKDLTNVVRPLSEYLGKGYVLLHFWNSRQPKESGLPQMKAIYDAYHQKGVQVISVALNSDNYPPAWRDEVSRQGLEWTQLWAGDGNGVGGLQSAIAQAYGIHALPEVILLDQEGTVVASPQTIEELEAVLRNLK